MRALRATHLLDIWERGVGRHPVDRALVILAFASPDQCWEELCSLPVGERNRLLLAVRSASFGARMDIVSACPACGESVEFDFTPPLQDFERSGAGPHEVELEGGGRVRLRLPDSRDLAAVARLDQPELARDLLARRCVLEPEGMDPRRAGEVLAWAVETLDPLASIAFPVRCPSCDQPWRATLDPVDYLWRELEQRVGALVREVHTLARAYGWTEAQVLDLSPARRRLYLQQVGA